MKFIAKNYLVLIYIVSLVATIGSLYFSEIEGFIPCTLCWYQRILMYPNVLLTGVALVFKDKIHPRYFAIIAATGAAIALYQYIGQKTGGTSSFINSCSSGASCASEYINWLGFITIPFLSLTAFSLIMVVSSIAWQGYKKAN